MATDETRGRGTEAQPPAIAKDDIEFDRQNPYRARAVPRGEGKTVLERARARAPRSVNTYPYIVEGSDSVRTGTSWGVLAVEDAETVETESGTAVEGTEREEAQPNRNTGEVTTRDSLQSTGSWSTIDTDDSAGSPTGNA